MKKNPDWYKPRPITGRLKDLLEKRMIDTNHTVGGIDKATNKGNPMITLRSDAVVPVDDFVKPVPEISSIICSCSHILAQKQKEVPRQRLYCPVTITASGKIFIL